MAEVILERRHYFDESVGTIATHWKNYDGAGADLTTVLTLNYYITDGWTINGQSSCVDTNGAVITIWTLTK